MKELAPIVVRYQTGFFLEPIYSYHLIKPTFSTRLKATHADKKKGGKK